MSFLRRLFGKPPPDPRPADQNELAVELLKTDWKCSCCGEVHHGIMNLAADWPRHWGKDHDDLQPSAVLASKAARQIMLRRVGCFGP